MLKALQSQLLAGMQLPHIFAWTLVASWGLSQSPAHGTSDRLGNAAHPVMATMPFSFYPTNTPDMASLSELC